MNLRVCKSMVTVALICAASSGHAQSVKWAHQDAKVTADGQITVKSVKSPGASVIASKNPSGKTGGQVVDLRQNAATQPPVLISTQGGPNRWSMYYSDRSGTGLP